MTTDPDPSAAAPASTVMLLRDGATGVEVFMVTRRADSRFMGGALVFPGGKVDPADLEAAPAWPGLADAAYRLAAIRELFEETGFLLAAERGERSPVAGERVLTLIDRWRRPVHDGAVSLERMLAEARLDPQLDRLVPFARWITPEGMRIRFDTRFYAAEAPAGQLGVHDGTELVDSRWVTPGQALAEADDGRVLLAFPTRLNLMLVTAAASVETALALLAARSVAPIVPEVVDSPGGRRVRIPLSAGYPLSEMGAA